MLDSVSALECEVRLPLRDDAAWSLYLYLYFYLNVFRNILQHKTELHAISKFQRIIMKFTNALNQYKYLFPLCLRRHF